MYMFLYSNLVYFFFIIYIQYYPKSSYIKYYKIIRALHGQLISLFKWWGFCPRTLFVFVRTFSSQSIQTKLSYSQKPRERRKRDLNTLDPNLEKIIQNFKYIFKENTYQNPKSLTIFSISDIDKVLRSSSHLILSNYKV